MTTTMMGLMFVVVDDDDDDDDDGDGDGGLTRNMALSCIPSSSPVSPLLSPIRSNSLLFQSQNLILLMEIFIENFINKFYRKFYRNFS